LTETVPVGPAYRGTLGHLAAYVAWLYDTFGQRKEMGRPSPTLGMPHFFLLRTFLGENDLLVILNTKRCRYQCSFCTLTAKSSRTWVPDDQVVAQFRYVADELKHALSVVDRVTLSNEGSVLDQSTLGLAALDAIVEAIGGMRRVRRIELETRLEFVRPERLRELVALAPRARLGILTGFETVDERIRALLRKRESLGSFLGGLDRLAETDASLTAYVLFKPDPEMSDASAVQEATDSIQFLAKECANRGLPLTVRLNPMYRASGSRWARWAESSSAYAPPRLTDVMRVAEEQAQQGVSVYIGLSTEGLAGDGGSYASRSDYSPRLVKYVKLFNDRNLQQFPWEELGDEPRAGVDAAGHA
jgi:radical SAM enzyme (TIGR01210 family)